jgi:sporulation protein YlmC with PRC-barrel domain
MMKRQIMTLAGVLALVAAPLAGPALAQPVGSSGATMPFVAQQPADEWLARVFIGQPVYNVAGEAIGDVNDLIFNRKGQISTVVIGVGGFLSIGEKGVGVPYSKLTFNVGKTGERVIVVALSKQELTQAPAFKATEKTTFDKVKDKAADLSHKTVDKAVELKDQATQKIDDMKKSEPTKQ